MNLDALRDGLDQAWTTVAAFTPKLLAAVAILVIGWFVARIVRSMTKRVLTRLRFNELIARAGIPVSEDESGPDPRGLAAGLIYGYLLFVTLQLTAQALDATVLATMLGELVAFLPLVLVAAAIVVIASAVAQFVARSIRANLGERGTTPARLAYWAIVVFAGIAALNVMNVAPEVVNGVLYAVLGTAAVASVIAFGVGGIPAARHLTTRWVHRIDETMEVVDLTRVDEETHVST